MKKIHIDLETFSSVDIKKCGVAKYVESPDFEILLFGYAIDGQPAKVIDFTAGEHLPEDIVRGIFDPNVKKKAFNAQFEITCLSSFFGEPLPPEQWECTSVHALYLGLPNDLGGVCDVLAVPPKYQKKKTGYALIRTFCVPCRPTKKNGGRTRNLPHHEPEKWGLFKEYCAGDVEAERFIEDKMSVYPLPEKERTLWAIDQRMFMRGVAIDERLVDAAIYCDDVIKTELTRQAIDLTGLSNPSSVSQLKKWLEKETGEENISLTKKDVPKLLASTDDSKVQAVLELRQKLSKSSVSKYHAMKRSVCADGRLRGVTQFYGANRTGRWAGRIVQLQNLPQNHLPDLMLARELVKQKDVQTLEMLYGSVPDVLSQLIRTALVPSAGKRLIPCDFSAIEARVIAWMAWCRWRIQVFQTHGKIYEASAEQMFRLPEGSVDKKSPYRQKGKVAELALGFQGGPNALINMGALDMGIAEEELRPIVDAWRGANPEIVQLWYGVEAAMKEAIRRKTEVTLSIAGGRGKIKYFYERGFLIATLPSGRELFYAKARIEAEDLWQKTSNGGKIQIARQGSVTYEGTDQKTKRWARMSTFGGRAVENLVQAIARDCLAESMLKLDDLGFDQLFTVHDEDVIEDDDDVLDQIEQLMGEPIDWAPGLPLKAEGFVTDYYMKEIE